jgi:hypothetical protein
MSRQEEYIYCLTTWIKPRSAYAFRMLADRLGLRGHYKMKAARRGQIPFEFDRVTRQQEKGITKFQAETLFRGRRGRMGHFRVSHAIRTNG